MTAPCGQKKPKELFGVYLGRVTHTRMDNLWVRVQVPQLLGVDTATTWARPMGFNSVGEVNPPVASILNDGDGIDQDIHPLGWGGFTQDPTGVGVTPANTEGVGTGTVSGRGVSHTPLTHPANPAGNGTFVFGNQGYGTGSAKQSSDVGTGRHGRPVGSGWETGPGPRPGTLVLVMFIAGDPNHPVYALTSQRVS